MLKGVHCRRFFVMPSTVGFGLASMFQIAGDPHYDSVTIVRSLDEVRPMLNVGPFQFEALEQAAQNRDHFVHDLAESAESSYLGRTRERAHRDRVARARGGRPVLLGSMAQASFSGNCPLLQFFQLRRGRFNLFPPSGDQGCGNPFARKAGVQP